MVVLVVSPGGASITPVTFDELLEPFPDTTQEAARRLRDSALTLIPDAVESCEGGDYGVGTAPGYKGLVFVITPQERGVRLGIAGGASLDDADGLMQGRGRVHRFVRVTDAAEANAPALRDLMRRAVEAAS
jgi:hypothetical protein